MLISAINFGMHYTAWQRRTLRLYVEDSESKFFLSAMAVCVVITCAYLLLSETLPAGDAAVHGLFQAVSITTTTGYATQNFAVWPSFLPVMLLMFSFMGGCVGSTGGGIKAMRLMLIYKQGIRELKQLLHPHAVIPLKVGNRRVEAKVVSAVWSFFAVYTFAFIVIMLLLMATGLDFNTAFSAVAASLNNLGPGLGAVAENYGAISDSPSPCSAWRCCWAASRCSRCWCCSRRCSGAAESGRTAGPFNAGCPATGGPSRRPPGSPGIFPWPASACPRERRARTSLSGWFWLMSLR
jgi:trk system potassium uptake protein TrkH